MTIRRLKRRRRRRDWYRIEREEEGRQYKIEELGPLFCWVPGGSRWKERAQEEKN